MKKPAPCSLTIGNFDGVHLGHRLLIQEILANNAPKSCVFTFEPHPREFLGIRPIPERICSPQEKIRRIESFKQDSKKISVHVENFDLSFSNKTAGEFLDYLENNFNPTFICVGKNFFFGKNRSGTTETLKKWGAEKNITVMIVETQALEIDGTKFQISSSEIRNHITSGNIKLANQMTLFPYSITAPSQSGDGRGKKMGIPTLNMSPTKMNADRENAKLCLPPHGVYITRVELNGHELASITNFGTRPTFHSAGSEEIFETHLLDVPENIKPQLNEWLSFSQPTVKFFDRIRAERRFDSQEELIQQIQADILIARDFHKLK